MPRHFRGSCGRQRAGGLGGRTVLSGQGDDGGSQPFFEEVPVVLGQERRAILHGDDLRAEFRLSAHAADLHRGCGVETVHLPAEVVQRHRRTRPDGRLLWQFAHTWQVRSADRRCADRVTAMKTYRLECSVSVPVSLQEAFAFFENPHNLARITPPSLNFRIASPERIQMRKGAEIDYQIRWLGLPLKWKTAIAEYEPPFFFVDEQVAGPYAHRSEERRVGKECRS